MIQSMSLAGRRISFEFNVDVLTDLSETRLYFTGKLGFKSHIPHVELSLAQNLLVKVRFADS